MAGHRCQHGVKTWNVRSGAVQRFRLLARSQAVAAGAYVVSMTGIPQDAAAEPTRLTCCIRSSVTLTSPWGWS